MEGALEDGGDIMPTLAERLRLEGRQQGVKQNVIAMVKNSLSKGYSLETISDFTGLPVDKILQIKNNQNVDLSVFVPETGDVSPATEQRA